MIERQHNPGADADEHLALCGPPGIGKDVFYAHCLLPDFVKVSPYFRTLNKLKTELREAPQLPFAIIAHHPEFGDVSRRTLNELNVALTQFDSTGRKAYAVDEESQAFSGMLGFSFNSVSFGTLPANETQSLHRRLNLIYLGERLALAPWVKALDADDPKSAVQPRPHMLLALQRYREQIWAYYYNQWQQGAIRRTPKGVLQQIRNERVESESMRDTELMYAVAKGLLNRKEQHKTRYTLNELYELPDVWRDFYKDEDTAGRTPTRVNAIREACKGLQGCLRMSRKDDGGMPVRCWEVDFVALELMYGNRPAEPDARETPEQFEPADLERLTEGLDKSDETW